MSIPNIIQQGTCQKGKPAPAPAAGVAAAAMPADSRRKRQNVPIFVTVAQPTGGESLVLSRSISPTVLGIYKGLAPCSRPGIGEGLPLFVHSSFRSR